MQMGAPETSMAYSMLFARGLSVGVLGRAIAAHRHLAVGPMFRASSARLQAFSFESLREPHPPRIWGAMGPPRVSASGEDIG